MSTIKRFANKINQGKKQLLYSVVLRIGDLRQNGFYTTSVLDPRTDSGYQRTMEESRTKQFANELCLGHKVDEAFLPGAIFLATEKALMFDNESRTILINHKETGPFNAVDGQHRLRGLIMAAETESSFDDFEVTVNIAPEMPLTKQMLQFYLVNYTQVPGDKALEQQIVARLTSLLEVEELPPLPKWLQRAVDKGEDARACRIVKYLNDEISSPWYKKIRLANDAKDGGMSINQKSFVASLKKYVLTPSCQFSHEPDVDKQGKILANYWLALQDLLVNRGDEQSVIFKTNGIHMFHSIFPAFYLRLSLTRDYKVETIKDLFKQVFGNLTMDYGKMGSAEFWRRGGDASGLNKAAFAKYAAALYRALHDSSVGYDEIDA